MKSNKQILSRLASLLSLTILLFTGCTDDFYLSEKEAAAYATVFGTQANAQMYFDNLQNQVLEIQFDNSTGSPRLSNTNLLSIMRTTELGFLEGGNNQISLPRLNGELEKQLDTYFNGQLQLYTGQNNAGVRLSRLDMVRVRFSTNPVFTYAPERQAIAFDTHLLITIYGTIEVTALDPITNFLFGGINGTYPLAIVFNDFRLNGEAQFRSPFANTGRIRFRLGPQPGPIQVLDNGTTIAPTVVKNGVRDLLAQLFSSALDENLHQQYNYFAFTQLRLTPVTPQSPSRLEVTYQARPETARPSLHAVVRAADGKLYHARKTVSAWSAFRATPFPALQTRIENDPALVSSGGDQLELAATTIAGDLVYAHWRDEAWGGQQTFSPGSTSPTAGYKGKPTIVASAPGQVEIFVEGRSGSLYHLRRLNGSWSPPATVPLSNFPNQVAPPFRDPVAVQSGNQVVLTLVDGLNRLRAIPFNLETALWGSTAYIQTTESVSFAPAAVVSGGDRIDVVYVGQSGVPYHRTLEFIASGIVVGPENTILHSSLTAAPVLACSGYHQLDLIHRGTDYRLWHKRYVDPALGTRTVDGRVIQPGWQSSSDLNGNFFGSATLSDSRMEEFTALSTPSGKIELMARVRPSLLDNNTQQFVFHNDYEGMRFGRDPWKTVQWRGYEQVSTQRFLGRPALAVIDRNFELSLIGGGTGTGPRVHNGHMTESNATSIALTSYPSVMTAPNPIDPIVLSSGPGIVDHIVMGDDGSPRHLRSWNYGSGPAYTLTVPTGVTLRSQLSAVSYGNGQIDLVAVGSDQGIYHWRFRLGNWSAPVRLNGSVISQAVVAHTGAGQLELLAIGGDQKLYRWRFIAGSWTSWEQIPSTFRINQMFFGPASVASWGDGTVDLLVVATPTGELFHRRIGPGPDNCPYQFGCPPARSFDSLGGNVRDIPALTAFSPINFSALAVGTDGVIYNNWAVSAPPQMVPLGSDQPIVWKGYEQVSWSGLLMGNTVNNGAKDLTTVAVDATGRLFLNRYTGWQWTGFQPVIGQLPEMQLSPPLFRPALASHGN